MSPIPLDQYESYESVILSGQVDQRDVPAILAASPDFAEWYRRRTPRRHKQEFRMPHQFEIIKDMFWSGEIGDVEFFELATDAGATLKQIGDFLAEVREQDGVEA